MRTLTLEKAEEERKLLKELLKEWTRVIKDSGPTWKQKYGNENRKVENVSKIALVNGRLQKLGE